MSNRSSWSDTQLQGAATREYRAILRLISERQCDSLGDFAMAEHLRGVLAQQHAPQAMRGGESPVTT